MNRFQQLVEYYEQGNITQVELRITLMQHATEENCHEIDTIPPEHLQDVRDYLATQPTTEEGWSGMRFFAIICWGRNVTGEYVDNYWKEQHRTQRRGVEVLRRYFASKEQT